MTQPQRRSLDVHATPVVRRRWPIETLWAQLEPLCPGLTIEVLAETDSSNTRLLKRARAGDSSPCLLVAERQSGGRGRLGRPWFSDGEASLTFSLGLELAPVDWSGLSLATGVALAEALHPSVRLKWPNDLWLPDVYGAGRKLGGVLIETLPLPRAHADERRRYAVVGVGLNLAMPTPRDGLTQPTAGWRELEPQSHAPDLLARLAPALVYALGRFEREGFGAFAQRFAVRDALCGRLLHTSDAAAPSGVADGVDAHGALRLQTDAGLRLISSAEVSVRPC